MAAPSLRIQLRPQTAQRTEQRLLLRPQMLQSIQVLQYSAGELSNYLAEQALTNEALELDSAAMPLDAPGSGMGPRGKEATEAHWQALQNHPQENSREASFESQLAALDTSAGESAWLRYLVDCLDPVGTLSMDDTELLAGARSLGLGGGLAALGRGIAQLQALEPRGLGGRNLEETLLLQLNPEDPDYPTLCRLIEECLQDLARNKWPKVARHLGLDLDEVKRLVAVLSTLDPKPGAQLATECAPVVHPELRLVHERDGGFRLNLDKGLWPEVRIDPVVKEFARDPQTPVEDRTHLQGKLEEARWLVDALEQRQKTLMRVANAVLQRQPGLLDRGPSGLAPLAMQDVAEDLGLAVSTISRAVAGKSIDTPWGVLALRDLFQAKAAGTSRGELREKVRCLVAAEDPNQPLSDEQIVDALAQEGLVLARRTVSKYRKELGIPSSYQRVQYGTRQGNGAA